MENRQSLKIFFIFEKLVSYLVFLRAPVKNWIKTRGHIVGGFILFFTFFFRHHKRIFF